MRQLRLIGLVLIIGACGAPVTPTTRSFNASPKATAMAASATNTQGPTVSVITSPGPIRTAVGTKPPSDLTELAARAAHSATHLADGSILIAGGCVVDGCGDATDETFILSVDQSFGAGPAMTHPRDSHTATLTPGGDVVLAGGFSGEDEGALSSVDIYRAQTGSIEAFSPLMQSRGGHAAAQLPDGRVLIVGGWIASHKYTSAVEIVDPQTGRVTRAAELPWAADALEAVALADGRVLVTGGQIEPAIATDRAAIYDSATDSWQETAPMNTPRLKHTTVLLGDGRVLVIGGSPDDQMILSTTEIFDPATLTFETGPNLLEPRYKMPGGATVVSADEVLIAGGGRSVELLDVTQGTSNAVETFPTRGSFATVTPLGFDAWLVLGGYDDSIRLRRAAAIIDRSQL